MIFLILFAGIGLGPDEAQYWTWSRKLDLGYYSKPPGIAWQIYLGTMLFGSTELGVRIGAVFIGTLLSLAIYYLAKKAQTDPKVAFYAGLLAAFTPFGFYGTFFAITDGGMLLFWTLALALLSEAIVLKKPPRYLLIGLLIGLGALFKWSIYLFFPVILLAWILYPFIRSNQILWGALISLLGLLPTLYWNFSHDFVTFKHVFTIVKGGNEGGTAGNPLDFIGSQAAILSPLVFLLLIYAWMRIGKTKDAIYFLGLSSLCLVGSFFIYALFKKVQGNWVLFAYPGAFVFLASQLIKRKGWLKVALILSLIVSLFSFSIPFLQKSGFLPWKISPFRHNVGLENLSKWLEKHPEAVLIADKYQTVSQVNFYNPLQREAYFLNLQGARKNQFSFWPISKEDYNKPFYFIFIDGEPKLAEKVVTAKEFYLKTLPDYFQEVGKPVEVMLFEVEQKPVKKALIFPVRGFQGVYPLDPERY